MDDDLNHSRWISLRVHQCVQEESYKRRHDRHRVHHRSILHGCVYSYAQRSGRAVDPEYEQHSSRSGRNYAMRRNGVSKTDAFSIQVLLDVRHNNRNNLDRHAAHGGLQEEYFLLRGLQITVCHLQAAILDENFPIRRSIVSILQRIRYY